MRSKAAILPAQNKKRAVFVAALVVLAAGALFTMASHAQQVYRIVGADGKVTFSDKPPPPAMNAKVTETSPSAGALATAGLPFELRQIANQYPVVLYTGENCAPCVSARSLLTTRGVPFVEKTVNRPEDIQALERLTGGSALPLATIGSQQLKGYADSEWTQFLNAAGYPVSSRLPANYRPPAPTPMVAIAPLPAAATPGDQSAAPSRSALPSVQPTTSPTGIQF